MIVVGEVLALPMRQVVRPVELYSKTGKYMNIYQNGQVVPSHGHRITSVITVIPVGVNRFKLRGTVSGLYVKITKSNRLRTTHFLNEATVFSEENLNENNFSSFRLANRSACRLNMARNGYKVICNGRSKVRNISFLPRRAHLPRLFGATF